MKTGPKLGLLTPKASKRDSTEIREQTVKKTDSRNLSRLNLFCVVFAFDFVTIILCYISYEAFERTWTWKANKF